MTNSASVICSKTIEDAFLLISRIFLVMLFVYSGYSMVIAPAETAAYFDSIGLPFPGIVLWLVIALKFVSGAMIVLGLKTQYAATALAVYSVAAAILGHSFSTPEGQLQILKDFSMAGGLLALAIAGPGRWSLDGPRRP